MKTEINKLKVVFEGRTLEIDIQKELSINENLLNSQLKDSPSSYYILASLSRSCGATLFCTAPDGSIIMGQSYKRHSFHLNIR